MINQKTQKFNIIVRNDKNYLWEEVKEYKIHNENLQKIKINKKQKEVKKLYKIKKRSKQKHRKKG
ncbi:hypothetical protein [Spiroplasma turonicum]|uniref:Uncharacterized protein n=1 Tax=Spiroplasma turonicum TaxID=216946 RepID=A0A0K1P685_9MOLU|nr:hypothetical protein [Spiroplasma turonicum]AKU79816.1 hypothetical protein STURON_00570 [Spiroplasma turonicum]